MNKPENSIINFFSSLSYRGNENALSDIIAAACNSSPLFKKTFLEFLFPNDSIISKCPSEIEREVSKNSGRTRFDLYFTTIDGTEYIVENKIYDKNDHYKEYSKLFSNHIAFIANYDVKNVQYSNKHTWKEFYNHLNKKLSLFTGAEKSLIEGILNYIQGICGIMEKRKFNLNKLSDLGYFISTLKTLLEENGFSINNQAKGSDFNRIGFWVYKNDRSYWFGIYLDVNKDDGYGIWGAIYSYELKDNLNAGYSEYHSEFNDLNSKWFRLKKVYLKKLSSETLSYEKKISILKAFIEEIERIS